MKTKTSQNAQRCSDFRDFLAGEGILPEVEELALKRVVCLQLQHILEQEHVTILVDPFPPPRVVIEEPELGLHPDLIPKIAELLIEATERMQLVVTSHSRMLIDALADDPKSVVVCSREHGESRMGRLSCEELSEWLETYSLGDLWSKGEIGGNRW